VSPATRTLAAVLTALTFVLGASPPEVVRLRVPSDRVADWFPHGTEIKGMSAEAFDRLLRDARSGAAARHGPDAPRLLRAGHSARWEGGVLTGRTELVIEPPPTGPGVLVLDPWTPAATPGDGRPAVVRSDGAGRTVVRVGPRGKDGGTVTAVVEWTLRARPGSGGRKFVIGLPGDESSALALDLPQGVEPEGPPGLRRGPGPAAGEGRTAWSFAGKPGNSELRLVSDDGKGDGPVTPRFWLGGPTRVQVGESSASWTTEWSVSGGGRARRAVTVALDPGLEPLGVSGPDVEDFRAEAGPDGTTRLFVRLRGRGADEDGAQGGTPVVVRGTTPVPSEGAWLVPSARPVGPDTVWTGGTATVRLDASRVVESVRPLSGRYAPVVAGAPPEDRRLVFEADRPGPVAEIRFRKPWADVSAEIRGHLLVGNAAPRLACRTTWRVHRGRPLKLGLDLPASWSADRVEVEGAGEAVTWHHEVLPGGGVRVHVTPPSGEWTSRPLVIDVWATASVGGGRGPLALPRVRPVGARAEDEMWVARAESGVTLRPVRARGLAWIDPIDDPAPAFTGFPGDGPAADVSRPALAWRWTADDAEGRVDRERSGSAPVATVTEVATLLPGRLSVEARVGLLSLDEPVRTLAVGLSEPVDDPAAWRVTDEATGRDLGRTPLDDRGRAAAGGLGRGPAWLVDVPLAPGGRVGLVIRHAGPGPGRGRLPLVTLPRSLRARGTLLVLAARDLRSSAEGDGLRVLDPDVTAESVSDDPPGPQASAPAPAPSGLRRAHAYAFDSGDAWVSLRTETLTPAHARGVIREAELTSWVDPRGGPGHRRLVLHVAPLGASFLDVTLPAGSTPERVRRDRQALTPNRSGAALSVPLAEEGQPRAAVVVTLDYRTAPPAGSDTATARPERPLFSMPCLSLAWEVVTPEPWGVGGWDDALTPADPGLTRPGLWDRLGGGRARGAWAFLTGQKQARISQASAMLRDFDERVDADRGDEAALGEWLARWDSGRWPVVVDRAALVRAGWGPRTRVVRPRPRPPRPGATLAFLKPLGLTAVPLGRTLLVSTLAEAPTPDRLAPPAARTSWESSLREAAALGADPSDRFESVARWREGPTPKGEAAADTLSPGGGHAAWRFVAQGWPGAGAKVVLIDRRYQSASGWAVALAVLTAGCTLRGRSRAARAAGISALFGLGLVATAAAPPRHAGSAVGLVGGSAALAFLTLGRALPEFRPWRRFGGPGGVESSLGRARLAARAVLAVAWLAGLAPRSRAEVGPDLDRILVLDVYDGIPDPVKPPDRVLLRLSDYGRLRALADRKDAEARPTLEATEAVHRVNPRDQKSIGVETELTLAATEGSGEARWTFPVEGAREISATLDGEEAPVTVETGGRTASVRVNVDGGHSARRAYRLRIRRSVAPRRGDWGESIALAVNPVAAALIEVGGHPSGLRAEVPCARGRVRERGGKVTGRLGPVDHLDVRWSPPGGAESLPPAGSVEGLYLWDATPAGDRVRARLTYRNPEGTPVVRVALGPGVVVRDGRVPGGADVTLEGTAERPEWVARFDPPLPDGATVSLDVWRARGEAGDDEEGEPRDPSAVVSRTAPRVEPRGVERLTGSLAFRRPPDWVGRVLPAAGPVAPLEALGEESFVRAWGALPSELLTLSGAVRLPPLTRFTLPKVSTGPMPARLRVVPSVQLAVKAGRIDLTADAELTETAGPVHEAEVDCPEGFHVVRVSGDGLTDWSRPTPRSVRLRFDGPPLRQRQVRVQGWVAVAGDPLAPSPASREVCVPWLRWPGQDEQSASLTVVSPTRCQLVEASGAAPVAPASAGASASAGGPFRSAYRVTRPDSLGLLRWEAEPTRVTVLVRSQLTVEPASAEWVAVLRYDVSGGPLDTVNLKLPAEWARSASVWLSGVAHQQVTVTRGETTYWTLRPERPVWGSQRLVVRSSVPFGRGEALAFPDLGLLGYAGTGGGVDTSLRVVNATREPIVPAGSTGLQPVAPGAPPPDELAAASPRSAAVTGYHVAKPRWSLTVQKAGDRGGGPNPARAELEVTLAADGSGYGLGRYDLGPRPGAFLPVRLPAGSSPLWASVDGAAVKSLGAGPGRWEIPLTGGNPTRVEFLWKSDPPGRATSTTPGPVAVALPEAGRGPVKTLVTVRSPAGFAVDSPPGRLGATSAERADLDRAAWQARQTAASLAVIDRSSRRGAEDLVADLVRFELTVRQAERAAALHPADTLDRRGARVNPVRAEAGRLRSQLAEVLGNESLDEFGVSARYYLGIGPAGSAAPDNPVAPTPDVVPPVQVRPVGFVRYFQGELDGKPGPPPLAWTTTPGPGSSDARRLLGLAVLGAVLTLAAWRAALRPGLPLWFTRAALVGGLAVAGYWTGPGWLLVGMGLAVLGRAADPAP